MQAETEYVTRLDALMPLIRERLEAGQTVRFSPMGISMLPMLRQGKDSVVLSPVPEKLKKYDLPLYQRPDGQYVLHRVVEVGDTYTCIGDNQFRMEPGVEHGQILALVTAFYRGGKRYEITNFRYRLYCGFWHGTRGIRHVWRRGIRWTKRQVRRLFPQGRK
jgi:hypothetical protein